MEERLDDAIHILRDQAEVNALAYGVEALGCWAWASWARFSIGGGALVDVASGGELQEGFGGYSRVIRSDAAV